MGLEGLLPGFERYSGKIQREGGPDQCKSFSLPNFANFQFQIEKCIVNMPQHVALNASQAGDYFIYMDSENQAMFQVSENFGGDLEQILKREDISCKATMRPNDIDAAPREMFAAPKNMFPAP